MSDTAELHLLDTTAAFGGYKIGWRLTYISRLHLAFQNIRCKSQSRLWLRLLALQLPAACLGVGASGEIGSEERESKTNKEEARNPGILRDTARLSRRPSGAM